MQIFNRPDESDLNSKTTVCVEVAFYTSLHNLIVTLEILLHSDWKYTKQQISSMEIPQTLLLPFKHFGENHESFLQSYHELKTQLSQKQFKVIATTCTEVNSMEKGPFRYD